MEKYSDLEFKKEFCADNQSYINFCNHVIENALQSNTYQNITKAMESVAVMKYPNQKEYFVVSFVIGKNGFFEIKNVYVTFNEKEAIDFTLDVYNNRKLNNFNPNIE